MVDTQRRYKGKASAWLRGVVYAQRSADQCSLEDTVDGSGSGLHVTSTSTVSRALSRELLFSSAFNFNTYVRNLTQRAEQLPNLFAT